VPLIDDVEPGDAEEVVRAPTLGETLRAERERQGLPLDEIERVTCVRAAQLRAIEEDRLEALPAEPYARGFVRTYAEHLSLDADAMVDLFNRQWSRLGRTDPAAVRLPIPIRDSSRSRLTVPLLLALVALAVSVAVYLSGAFRDGSHHASPPLAGRTSTALNTTTPPAGETGSGSGGVVPAGRTVGVHVTILATPGSCWIEARRGSATGPLLAERTLAASQVVHLHGRRIWLRLGSPANARVRRNGHGVALGGGATPVDVLLTPQGETTL
jgi:hypothetical protein